MFLWSSFFFTSTFLFIQFNYFNLASCLNFCLLWDQMSSLMTILTLWVTGLIILVESTYMFKLNILMISLVVSFNTKNTLLFFISFEVSIIPILLIILLKGYQPERLEAGLSLLMYTFTASTSLLFCLLLLFFKFKSFNFLLLYIYTWEMVIFMIFAFLVKLPMWTMHMWLPKAHVEAPVGGSMILAAIMLKLGVYGLFRLFMILDPNMKSMMFWLMAMGLIGMVMSSVMCFFSSDIKMLIAYSSVSHMSPMILILSQFNNIGFNNSILLALSHGFSSSLMFFTGNLIYLNSKTRMMMSQKGGMLSNPLLTLILFWSIAFNLAVPPFLSFFSEIMMFVVLFMQTIMIMPLIFILIMLSGIYNTYLYMNLGFGKEKMINTKMLKMKEILIFFLHLLPLILIPLIS